MHQGHNWRPFWIYNQRNWPSNIFELLLCQIYFFLIHKFIKNQFQTVIIIHVYNSNIHSLTHSPSRTQSAVHCKAALRQEQFPPHLCVECIACRWHIRKSAPNLFSNVCGLQPAPLSRGRQNSHRSCNLSPAISSLIHSSFHMLNQSCSSARYQLKRPSFLREQHPSCLIDFHFRTCSVIKKNDESLEDVHSSVALSGLSHKRWKDDVTSGYESHVFHAVFLPLPEKEETVSQPVMAWNIGGAFDFSGPKLESISWTGRNLRFSPSPKAIYNSEVLNVCETAITITTTSVSTVRKSTFVNPLWTASATWTIILVSASSWLPGARLFVSSRGGLQRTCCERVLTTCLLLPKSAERMWFAKNVNSSVLFSFTRRNSCQLFGSFVDDWTLLRMPLPRFPSSFPLGCLVSIHPILHQLFLRAVTGLWCME